jgi:hypothetical protein
VEIVGQIDQKLDAVGRSESNPGVRSIYDLRARPCCQIHAILRLQAAVWDDKARVGHIGPVRLNVALDIRAIFSGRGHDNLSLERREQKRDRQRATHGVDGGQLTIFLRVKLCVYQGRTD